MMMWTVTGKERRGQQEGFAEGDTELDHGESKEPTLQRGGEAPRQRAQSEQMCTVCLLQGERLPRSSAMGNTRLSRFLYGRTSQVFTMLLCVMNLQDVSPRNRVLLNLI